MTAKGSPTRALRESLLGWYRSRRGAYPWRRPNPDPYAVLVSEFMLQQTQAVRVGPVFRAFLARFPTVDALAAAPRREVLRAWGGLGYNRRAVALAETARVLVREHGGRVPDRVEDLIRLPGVGPYTAAAVASIAYGVPVVALDTNVRRIVARAAFGAEAHGVAPGALREAAERWLDRERAGEWNQALMDLGRHTCRPQPLCGSCPLLGGCRFHRNGVSPLPAGGRSGSRFQGSFRQVRGRVVKVLLDGPISLGALSRKAGHPPDRVAAAVAALARERLVTAGPAALAGRPGGRVRLAD